MDKQFVSRGGIKLQAALDQFKIDVKGKICLDVGSSTGGFVDCLLQNGTSKIYSVDTSYGELAWTLRNNPKVEVLERTNILHLKSLPSVILGSGNDTRIQKRSRTSQDDISKVDLITIDSGWTKLELVLPVVKNFLKSGGVIIALLKPQYETDQHNLKKGVVEDDKLEDVKNRVVGKIENLGFKVEEVIESPILGGGGNKEFLLKIKRQ